MKRDFQAFKNRTAVTKEERLRQRKKCIAIGKELPHYFSYIF